MAKSNRDSFAVPKGELKERYFDLFMEGFKYLGAQITQPDVHSRSGVPYTVSFIISLIPNLEHQQEIRKKISDEITKQLIGVDDLEDKQQIIIETNIEMVGLVSIYLENFMGIEKQNRLGVVKPGDINE